MLADRTSNYSTFFTRQSLRNRFNTLKLHISAKSDQVEAEKMVIAFALKSEVVVRKALVNEILSFKTQPTSTKNLGIYSVRAS
jgi:hypothetical protein